MLVAYCPTIDFRISSRFGVSTWFMRSDEGKESVATSSAAAPASTARMEPATWDIVSSRDSIFTVRVVLQPSFHRSMEIGDKHIHGTKRIRRIGVSHMPVIPFARLVIVPENAFLISHQRPAV